MPSEVSQPCLRDLAPGLLDLVVREALTEFLEYINDCREQYQAAHESVKTEERRLQDLLHELELAEGENAKRRAATKLRNSRRQRRRKKDEAMRLELIVNFFDEPAHKNSMNKMKQLVKRQKKQEEFLDGERHYNQRVKPEG